MKSKLVRKTKGAVRRERQRLDALRYEELEVERRRELAQAVGGQAAALERLDVERARHPDLVRLDEQRGPMGGDAVGLVHRPGNDGPGAGVRRPRRRPVDDVRHVAGGGLTPERLAHCLVCAGGIPASCSFHRTETAATW